MDALKMHLQAEWLESDGLGGFASGTIAGMRTRRYHALLLAATTPPSGRVVLVNGFDAWVDTPRGKFALSSHHYVPDVLHPDGVRHLRNFTIDPWPSWEYEFGDGLRVRQELFVPKGLSAVVLSWRLLEPTEGITLSLRPLISGRDYHSLHHENSAFRFDGNGNGKRMIWRPYPDLPGIVALSNGEYSPHPDWYRNFLYSNERARGLDFAEDLASPGVYRWDLSQEEAVWLLGAEMTGKNPFPPTESAEQTAARHRDVELQRRQAFPSPLHRAADAYIVQRGPGKTIVAGYPWFTDWGRDTFIALRGLCLATGWLDIARDILTQWAGVVSQGMLPNRFPDQGDHPEFNSVDSSLWYVIAVYDYFERIKLTNRKVPAQDRKILQQAIESILTGYSTGTRFGIRLDEDGLLAAGEPGVQLTWMDAKVGDWVVTPRIGKPVEVEALWLNGLWIGSAISEKWWKLFIRGRQSFRKRFWNESGGCLFDVVDTDHRSGETDGSFRPNQIFAIGGLPLTLLDGARARRVVEAVEAKLWTPMGLRSLAPEEPGYRPRYEGGVFERDSAYHQGTVWPWLLGPFVEAWLHVRGNTVAAKREAHRKFLEPIFGHLGAAGIGHVSEIADGNPPHEPRGCPFQAWSVGEILRLELVSLRDGLHRSPEIELGESNHEPVQQT